MAIIDLPAHAYLNGGAEVVEIERIDPPIHEAEAVRGADDGIAVDIQDRAAVDADAVDIAAEPLPCVRQ